MDVLIAFYSLTGNTKAVAERAASLISDRGRTVEVLEARVRGRPGFVRCALSAFLGLPMRVEELAVGDAAPRVVAVGGPVWAWRLSPPTGSLARSLGRKGLLSNRKVVPFLTCADSAGRAPGKLAEIISSLQGFPVEPVIGVIKERVASEEEAARVAAKLAETILEV